MRLFFRCSRIPAYVPARGHPSSSFTIYILIFGSTSVLFIQTPISCFFQLPVCSVHKQISQTLLLPFQQPFAPLLCFFSWFFLIESFGMCSPHASGGVPCETIMANEIGWEIFQGGETSWEMFLQLLKSGIWEHSPLSDVSSCVETEESTVTVERKKNHGLCRHC